MAQWDDASIDSDGSDVVTILASRGHPALVARYGILTAVMAVAALLIGWKMGQKDRFIMVFFAPLAFAIPIGLGVALITWRQLWRNPRLVVSAEAVQVFHGARKVKLHVPFRNIAGIKYYSDGAARAAIIELVSGNDAETYSTQFSGNNKRIELQLTWFDVNRFKAEPREIFELLQKRLAEFRGLADEPRFVCPQYQKPLNPSRLASDPIEGIVITALRWPPTLAFFIGAFVAVFGSVAFVIWWETQVDADPLLLVVCLVGVPVGLIIAVWAARQLCLNPRLVVGTDTLQVMQGFNRLMINLPFYNIAEIRYDSDGNSRCVAIEIIDVREAETYFAKPSLVNSIVEIPLNWADVNRYKYKPRSIFELLERRLDEFRKTRH